MASIRRVHFYYDPSCPWCWITSRWLMEVSNDRSLDIVWLPFSLALKNNELVPNENEASPYGAYHRSSHRLLRVIEAAVQKYGENARSLLYTAAGSMYHIVSDEEYYTDEMIVSALQNCGYNEELLNAADEGVWDTTLQSSLDEARKVVGDDVGVPTIVFELDDGQLTGYFGPVIAQLPDKADGLKLWDGLAAMVSVPGFYELKRSRSVDADTSTTKRTLV